MFWPVIRTSTSRFRSNNFWKGEKKKILHTHIHTHTDQRYVVECDKKRREEKVTTKKKDFINTLHSIIGYCHKTLTQQKHLLYTLYASSSSFIFFFSFKSSSFYTE